MRPKAPLYLYHPLEYHEVNHAPPLLLRQVGKRHFGCSAMVENGPLGRAIGVD
ncbi:hypothetical protein [Pseudomonas fluorescens]|jgi:hypothetical protein|uniref:hypothetical protein n=1 Tax=Pseudomonas fluorescens TaxID=294 RepID=UPI0015907E70|nr:hypothetical protein [Pseudomonas fluorescens]MBC8783342.1 hypothetical protein [Pseudomonas fluorescens]UEL25384.1 hypothetical protein K6106_08275 [Pseudomonas fluorescens]